ncbi:uncharacterized protein [Primulina eburnea]|uniref:uncharacterized protein isoform X1 n=1 Tax=Primulina eburnea TaxID=1245227 RepID=UPI003C6C4EEE
MESSSGRGVIYTKEQRDMSFESPFTLKVGQVFTGFGIGCGIGIGIGRPLNLGSVPVLNQVMVAARGATDAFSGVQRNVNSSLRKVGAKNIQAGIGCGIGFGHGFGVGLAVKPRVVHQIQSHLFKAVTHVMEKLGIVSTLPINQGLLPASFQTSTRMIKDSVSSSSFQDNIQDGKTSIPLEGTLVPKNDVVKTGSRTEMTINNFLKNPILQKDMDRHEQVESLQLENNMLQMVLKHQLLIEELTQESKKLHQILVEVLKVDPSKFQSSFTSSSKPSCTECFECRRKQRRR